MSKCGTPKMMGGVGTATHGEAVYGSAGQQHAVAGTNVIAMNAPLKGGKKTKRNNGGNVLSDIALPVSLIYANQTFSNKKSRKNKYSNKNKKSIKNRRRSFRRYKK